MGGKAEAVLDFIERLSKYAEPSEPGEDWISFDGVNCPVSKDEVIEVRYQSGLKLGPDKASAWRWGTDQHQECFKMVAYRICRDNVILD